MWRLISDPPAVSGPIRLLGLIEDEQTYVFCWFDPTIRPRWRCEGYGALTKPDFWMFLPASPRVSQPDPIQE